MERSFSLEIDLKTYSPTAIKNTCYRTANLFTTQVSTSADTATVVFWPKANIEDSFIRDTFLTELVDQSLREQIAERTDPIKQLILAHAFSRTDLLAE